MKRLLYLWLMIPAVASSQGWSTRAENNSSKGETQFAFVEGKSNNVEKPFPILQVNYDGLMTRWHLVGVPFINCKIDQFPILIKFDDDKKVYKAPGWGEKKHQAVWIQFLPGPPLTSEEISEKEFHDMIRLKKTIKISFVTECGTFDTEFSLSGSSRALKEIHRNLPDNSDLIVSYR